MHNLSTHFVALILSSLIRRSKVLLGLLCNYILRVLIRFIFTERSFYNIRPFTENIFKNSSLKFMNACLSPLLPIFHSSHNHLCLLSLLSLNCIVLHVLNYTYMAIMMVIVIPHITLDGSSRSKQCWKWLTQPRSETYFSKFTYTNQ